MKTVKPIIDPLKAEAVCIALLNQHPRFYLMWRLGVSSGLRVSDLLKLTPSHFSRKGDYSVRESKTGNWRSLKLTEKELVLLRQHIKRYKLQPTDCLFFSSEARKRQSMSRQWAHRVISRTAKKTGVQGIGSHSMRKIYACNKLYDTGSVEAVQKELGHKHVSTTLLYLKDLFESKIKQD